MKNNRAYGRCNAPKRQFYDRLVQIPQKEYARLMRDSAQLDVVRRILHGENTRYVDSESMRALLDMPLNRKEE